MRYREHPDLPSFPTRRSSDLKDLELCAALLATKRLQAHLIRERLRETRMDDRLRVLTTERLNKAIEMRSEEHTLNSSHVAISYAVFCLKKKKRNNQIDRETLR